MDKELKRFLLNVYFYLLLREGEPEFAVMHLRQWGMTQKMWEQMWENEEDKPDIAEDFFR